MSITAEQKSFLNKYILNLDEVLTMDDPDELLLEIDSAIVRTFDAEGNPSPVGVKLQSIYDEIYNSI